ncbi:GRASP55/65 PDZ-like domain-containing protein [Dipodascopsis uninucleata]
MGNEQSMQQGWNRESDLLESYGFRILKVKKGSLAEENGLESFFDFICGINGHQIEDGNAELFVQEIQNCAGKSVKFTVFTSKGQQLREVMVALPEKGESEEQKVELGMALQWAPLALSDVVFHVLNVQSGSPADKAGLQADSDFIIGIDGYQLISEYALGEILEANLDQELMLQVYNHDYNTVRLTTIMPTKNWGGDGVLGCGIGFGYLHRIPEFQTGVPLPGDTIFSADEAEEPTPESRLSPLFAEGNNGSVPVTQTEMLLRQMSVSDPGELPNIVSESTTIDSPTEPPMTAQSESTPSTATGLLPSYMRRKHYHHSHVTSPTSLAAQSNLHEYFDEQERINKDSETRISNNGTPSVLPPPPKDSEIHKASVNSESTQEPVDTVPTDSKEDDVD